MRIWDFVAGDLVEVSHQQYDFIQAIIKANGVMDKARELYPVTEEQFNIWKDDAIYNQVLKGWESVIYKSRGLCAEYIKAKLFEGIEKDKLTKTQLNAINTAAKCLGLGATQRQFKAEIAPNDVKIVFNDGEVINGN
jgi:hypothetical protein